MDVTSGASCTENFSGVGMTLYVFNANDLEVAPDYNEEGGEDGVPGYTTASFDLKKGAGAYHINLKRQSGKVTSTSTPDGGGFVNTFTGVVAANMEKMSLLARTLNNSNEWGAMIGDGKGGYYVLYDPTFGISFTIEGDTGDTPESDHGFTITIAAGPMLYPLAKWKGSLPIKSDGGETKDDTVPGAGA